MEFVKVGIVGLGNIGSVHAKSIFQNKIKGLKLTAVCDIEQSCIEWAKENFEGITCYSSYEDMVTSGTIDAVIIAVPHYLHPEFAINALSNGLNVLSEKPIGVFEQEFIKLNETACKSGKVFAIMHNQRTSPIYSKIRELVQAGKLGRTTRLNWTVTNWYRTQEYYDSGTWRATWEGEGGGVLLNQAYHNIDLWQWMFGMPSAIRGFCSEGKFHDIEVEDEASIYAEYENGATAFFTASTGEFPGTNRLEVCGTLGKITAENGRLFLWSAEVAGEQTQEAEGEIRDYSKLYWEHKEIVIDSVETGHLGILQNFTNAILTGEELLSPGYEGVNALRIINAAYYSSWQSNKRVDLPVDADIYFSALSERIKAAQAAPPGQKSSGAANADKKPPDEQYSNRWKINW